MTPELQRIAAAARKGQPASPPAETPWTEWHGGECPLKDAEVEEWEVKYQTGITKTQPAFPQSYRWNHTGGAGDIIAYRVTKWREGFDPAAVDWKARHNELQKAYAGHADVTAKLPHLRPIAEAGEVPAGAVRVYAFKRPSGDWFLSAAPSTLITHFTDILLPEAKAPAVEAAKPAETFTAHDKTWTRHTPGDPMPCDGEALVQIIAMCEHIHNPLKGKDWNWQHGEIIGWRYADEPTPAEPVKPWTPAVGDVVMLKSGGPKMTVVSIKDSEGHVVWFQAGTPRECDFHVATLQPA